MTYLIKLLATAAAAALLHTVLGWGWTFFAGLGAGVWQGRGGWYLGAIGVGIEWAGWIIFSYAVDARAVHVMTQTMGSILGNMPFFVVVALTLIMASLIGGLGGGMGTQIRVLMTRTRTPRAAA